MLSYEILGIAANATEQEINKAYRRLAMKFHPDRNPGDKEAEEKFKQIQNAYDEITKPSHKKPYKKQTYQPPKPKDENNWIKDAPPPTHDLWGNPIEKEEQTTYTPPIKRRIIPKLPPEEPPIDIWKGTYDKTSLFIEAYWRQYEKLKREMAYEEPEKFWKALNEWVIKNK